MIDKGLQGEVEIYCPKCRGTEYTRCHIHASAASPEGWYYHCEGCNFTSEPE